ncbi:MAG: prenyltransferase/squalene oxidase repeat-containing protein [Thermoguttaceae bacterium]|jgi:hypothetical protein
MRNMPRPGRLARWLVVVLAAAFAGAAGGDDAGKVVSVATGDKDAVYPYPLATQGPKPKPVPPVENGAVNAAIDRGIAFLVKRQNSDGSWGSAHNTKGLNIYAPVPGAHQAFRAATTSLCISALIESGTRDPSAISALERGEEWLMESLPRVRRATPDAIYNSWAHAYSIEALVRMHGRAAGDGERQAAIVALINSQIDLLGRYECVDGGWCYYDFDYRTKQPGGSSISFVSATVLVAFHEAAAIGVEIPERLVDRAVESIRRQRNPDFSYCYGEYLKYRPRYGINRPGGSLGRSQACNLAMRFWGDELVTDEVLTTWLDRLFARNLWLDIGRKRPIPHESWFQVAAYFFYYGHYYAALCVEQLKPEVRPPHQDHLAAILFELQEKDGSWWDFPFYDYHQQYGTAFAVMTLTRCRKP